VQKICLYNILGISKTASHEDVRKAYKTKCLQFHPDKNKSINAQEEFLKVQEAYKILSDETKRQEYDNMIDVEHNPLIEMMMKIISEQLDLFIKKSKEANTKKPSEKPPDLHISVDATLDEIYRGSTKIVKLNVLRNNVMTPVSFGISLVDFWEESVFEKEGDNCLSDVIFSVNPIKHDKFMIDNIVKTYDLLIELPITLHEVYMGYRKELPFLADKTVLIERAPGLSMENKLTVVIPNHGFPYYEDEHVKRGKLYIFFRLHLPKQIPVEAHDFLNQYFKDDAETIYRISIPM